MKLAVWFLIAAVICRPLSGAPTLAAEDDPLPSHWHLTIEFRLSQQAVHAVSKKRIIKDFTFVSVTSDGYLRGFVDSSAPSEAADVTRPEVSTTFPLVSIPNRDLTNVIRKARSLISRSGKLDPSGLAAPTNGVAIRFGMRGPDGRHVAVFQAASAEGPLPEQPMAVLTLLNRNLPAHYELIFQYLQIGEPAGVDPNDPAPFGVCKKHHSALKVETVPIVFGLPDFDLVEMEAAERLFPNSGRNWPTGCIFGPGAPKNAPLRFCPSCRDAEERWTFRRLIDDQQRHPKIEPRQR